jgi:ERCC4-related helicase
MERQVPTGPEAFFNLDDPPEVLALNFPPVERERRPTDRYIPSDSATLRTFLYPSNVPRRDYQFEISKICFQHNTLVCLPTGTGKTFIAAVVMMNFHRWYPTGKIIFVAHMRTLVQQQINACSSFTQIPSSRIIELTGATAPSSTRTNCWQEKSIIFATPQVVQHDIELNRLDPTQIVLLIVDEAHHAHGRFAFSQVVRLIAERSAQFRVVALTATPGNNVRAIQSVIFNLMISRIIFKDDTDPEVSKYQHSTSIERISVPLAAEESALLTFLGKCMEIFAQPLHLKGHLPGSDPKFLSKGRVWFAMDQFKKAAGGKKDFFTYMNMFTVLHSLAGMQEKLARYGAASLNDALKDYVKRARDTEAKRKLVDEPAFQQLIRMAERAKTHTHPKLAKLSLILQDFFTHTPESRAMVFTEFRATAYEVSEHINKIDCVKSSVFIGKADTRQNAGLDDSLQHQVVSLFRKGKINCIVATSVGEEGLDIGEVDLIVCYDTGSSPLKIVQRMGRTGRKRCGRVVFLMSEGFEEKGLEKAQNSRTSIRNRLTTDLGRFCLYSPEVPNMQLPQEPECVALRCARERTLVPEPAATDSRCALLSRNESHAMNCCFGGKLKFRKVRLSPQKSRFDEFHVVISHSFESGILARFCKKKEELEIPQTIQDEVSRLFAVDETSGSSDDDAIANTIAKRRTQVMVSDSDELEDADDPCLPLSMHLHAEEEENPEGAKQRNFLSDDDDDRSFLSDDDEEFIARLEADARQETDRRPCVVDIGSDGDDLEILDVLPPPPKKPQIFLDSDDDLDYVAVL